MYKTKFDKNMTVLKIQELRYHKTLSSNINNSYLKIKIH